MNIYYLRLVAFSLIKAFLKIKIINSIILIFTYNNYVKIVIKIFLKIILILTKV